MISFFHFQELPKIKPMIIGVWYGETKPVVNEYIMRLVTELKEIISNGIQINSNSIKIKFGLVICDTPARSLMKGIPILIKIVYLLPT